MPVTVTPGVSVQATTGLTLTATIPASVDGDVTLLCVNSAAASGTQVLNVPVGWNALFGAGGVHEGGRPGGVANVFWRKWVAGDPATQAVTHTISGYLIITPLLVRGTIPDAPFEASDYYTNVNVVAGSDIPAPSLTAVKSQFLLVFYAGYYAINSARTWTPPPGMTEIVDYAPSSATAANGVSVHTKVLSAPGATGIQNAKSSVAVYPVGFSMLLLPPPPAPTVMRGKGGVPLSVRYKGQP